MYFGNLKTRAIYVLFELDDIAVREDLSFDHRKPKKSEITELEESEALLQQLCDITSVN